MRTCKLELWDGDRWRRPVRGLSGECGGGIEMEGRFAFSKTVTLMPALESFEAHIIPTGPAPTTTTWVCRVCERSDQVLGQY